MQRKLQMIACPTCGYVNRNLDLEDSKGLMECERCGTIAIIPIQRSTQVRIYRTNTIKYLKPIKC